MKKSLLILLLCLILIGACSSSVSAVGPINILFSYDAVVVDGTVPTVPQLDSQFRFRNFAIYEDTNKNGEFFDTADRVYISDDILLYYQSSIPALKDKTLAEIKAIVIAEAGDNFFETCRAGYSYAFSAEIIPADGSGFPGADGTWPANMHLFINGTEVRSELYDGAVVITDDDATFTCVADFSTVTFNMNGHGTQITPQKIPQGSKAAEPVEPAAPGYIFDGWFTDAKCSVAYDFNTAVTADTVLYAKWISLNPFDDVTTDDYFFAPVVWAVGNGITKGTSDTTFGPANKCLRGQMVTFLYRYAAN